MAHSQLSESKGEMKREMKSDETKYVLSLDFECNNRDDSARRYVRIGIPVYLNAELKMSGKTLVPDLNHKCILSLVKRASDRLSLTSKNKDVPLRSRGLVGVKLTTRSGTDEHRVKENRLYNKTERAKAFGKLDMASITAPVTSSVRGALGAVGSIWIPPVGTTAGLVKGLKRGAVAPFEAFLGDRYLQTTDKSLVIDLEKVPFEFVISHLKFPQAFGSMDFTLYIGGTFHIEGSKGAGWGRLMHEGIETVIPWTYPEGEQEINWSLRNSIVSMEIDNARLFPSSALKGMEFKPKRELKDLCRSHKNCVYFNI